MWIRVSRWAKRLAAKLLLRGRCLSAAANILERRSTTTSLTSRRGDASPGPLQSSIVSGLSQVFGVAMPEYFWDAVTEKDRIRMAEEMAIARRKTKELRVKYWTAIPVLGAVTFIAALASINP